MSKAATYRNDLSFEWLLALSLAFTLIVFPGNISTAEACRPLPQRIEVVKAGQDDAENAPILHQQVVASDFSSSSLLRARAYELVIQISYQRQVKETLDTISERTYSYSPPVFFWIAREAPHTSDDSTPHIFG